MLKIAIVEDDDNAAAGLEDCLRTYCDKNKMDYSAERFSDASGFLERYSPRFDLIFMDIKMPGMDGMTAARQLRQIDSVTGLIFVTSMAQYAVKGYEMDALDFIVKPVQYFSFEMKMRRAMQAVRMKKGREVLLSVGGVTRVLPSAAIYYVEVMDHDLTYHTEGGPLTARGKLSAVEAQLPRGTFFRCASSYLINLQHVTQVDADTVQVGGENIRISRGRKKELMAALAAFLGRGV